jgi:hypothetical protein
VLAAVTDSSVRLDYCMQSRVFINITANIN